MTRFRWLLGLLLHDSVRAEVSDSGEWIASSEWNI